MALSTSPAPPQVSRLPYLWALAYVLLFGFVFVHISWSFGDTYSHLVGPALSSWSTAIADAFTARGREYRPFFTLGIKAAYEAAGTWLPFYHALVLLSFGAILALIVWVCRPDGRPRTVAACIAVSCFCGLHTSRILFGFWPLNHYAAVMVALLLSIALTLEPRIRRIDWVFAPLVFVAILGLELGILIVPVLIVLWWFGAPGISWRGVTGVLAAVAVYLAIRFTFGDHSAEMTFWADGAFGFEALPAETLRARFGGHPWTYWAYNVSATFFTVLFSEPRNGVYAFVESLLARDMESWQWFQVGVSTLTTMVIAGGLAKAWPWRERERLLVAAGCALLVFGSALAFVYTRDRLGLAGGIGYALLLYVACASWLDTPHAPGWRRRLASSLVTLVATLWMIRSAELWFQLRDTAWDYHVEWSDRFEELGGTNPTPLMLELRAKGLEHTPPDPRHDPAWTYLLFERRFHRAQP